MKDNSNTQIPQPTTVGAYITRERAKRRILVSEVAERAGMQTSTVMRIESGQSQVPGPDALRKIARVLDLPTLKLFQLAGYSDGDDLPEIEPYLRAKYGEQIPGQAATEFAAIARKYGLDPTKTDPGDDLSP